MQTLEEKSVVQVSDLLTESLQDHEVGKGQYQEAI